MTTAERLITIAENQEKVYEAGEAAGQKSERDHFWDTFQRNGERNIYSYAFWRNYWNDECYNPKYPLIGKECNNCFYLSGITDTKVPIHFTGSVAEIFRSSSIKIIRKIISDESTSFYRWFEDCRYLESVTFEGVICNDIAFSKCPLTRDSILSVLEHLSTDVTGKTATFKQTAVNAAFTTEEWDALKATKSNWTIAVA